MKNFSNKELKQPVISMHPEPNHQPEDVLTITSFLDLLKDEEDYFDGDQHHTKLMITRLRKIFYDKWGWNRQLIRGAAWVECRYQVQIVTEQKLQHITAPAGAKKIRRYRNYKQQSKYRLVTYRKNDKVYGNTRYGQTPVIYDKNHQEVRLPDGSHCDVAHVLAGLDAYNHPQVVCPLPAFLSFLYRLFPHVTSNVDIVTWLGDIASSAGDFLFEYLRNHYMPLDKEIEQHYININAPGSDMLGDIDAYVIHTCYADASAKKGKRVTEILHDYYCSTNGELFRQHRFSKFCEAVGLKGWDGYSFSNEEKWLQYYQKQLRNNTAFQLYSLQEESLKSLLLSFKVWRNGYREVIQCELLLRIFLTTLKELIKKES